LIFEQVPISQGNIWDEYTPMVYEELVAGFWSTTSKAKKNNEGLDGQEYFIKTISDSNHMWTARNECEALELAGNMPGVIKCH